MMYPKAWDVQELILAKAFGRYMTAQLDVLPMLMPQKIPEEYKSQASKTNYTESSVLNDGK